MAINVNVPVTTNELISDLNAMRANLAYVILGDGSAGVLRMLRLDIAYSDGTDIQLYTTNVWNGDAIDTSGSPHVISKGDNDTNWIFAADGTDLTIKNAGLTGNAAAAFGVITYNKCGEASAVSRVSYSAYGINVAIYLTTGLGWDLTNLAAGESIKVDIIYITDA